MSKVIGISVWSKEFIVLRDGSWISCALGHLVAIPGLWYPEHLLKINFLFINVFDIII